MADQVEIRAELVQSDSSLFELDIFVMDLVAGAFVLDGIKGTASLRYADGTEAAVIEFDEYFGCTTGSFKVEFANVADYSYSGVQINLTSPVTASKFASIEDKLDISEDGDFDSIARPVTIT